MSPQPTKEVVMGYIGGKLQELFVERVREADRERLLAVPIDVGKHQAAALVCDFWGELVAPPFTFSLNEPGLAALAAAVARAEAEREALWVRAGLEEAGHYHETLLARLLDLGWDVAVLNPAQVKENRAQDLLRSPKTDARDLGAMAELLIRGKGRPATHPDPAMATQAAWSAYRRRKVKARTALKNQVHASLDLVFPGLSGCFDDILDPKVGRVLLAEAMDPDRVRRLGQERLRSYCRNRGVMVRRAKAAQVVEAAKAAFVLPKAVATTHARVLRSDVGLLAALDGEIAKADEALTEILPSTPAAILTTIPRVAVVRASMYGAAVGDVSRFKSASQVYRLSGLVPRHYESAGRRRAGTASPERARPNSARPSWSWARPCTRDTPTSADTPPSSHRGGSGRSGGMRPGTPGQPSSVRADARPGAVRSRSLEVRWSGRARHGRASSTRATSPVRQRASLPSTDRPGKRGGGGGAGGDVASAKRPSGLRR